MELIQNWLQYLFWSEFIVFNESNIASIITALTLMLSVKGPLTGMATLTGTSDVMSEQDLTSCMYVQSIPIILQFAIFQGDVNAYFASNK